MPDLETLLLDVRPTPRPEFTAKLDAQVAARFPKPVPRWKRKLRTLREHAAGLTLAAATAGAMLLIVVVIAKNVDGGGGALALPQLVERRVAGDAEQPRARRAAAGVEA